MQVAQNSPGLLPPDVPNLWQETEALDSNRRFDLARPAYRPIYELSSESRGDPEQDASQRSQNSNNQLVQEIVCSASIRMEAWRRTGRPF